MRWLRPQRHSAWILRAGIAVLAVYIFGGTSDQAVRYVGLALILVGFLGAIIEGIVVRHRDRARSSIE
jgi:hypothetical protein